MEPKTAEDYHVTFDHVIPLATIYVIKIHVNAHYGMSMFYTKRVFLILEQEYY